jgi:aryl-alcohol dehydrogenase-like predicted oxidoreductase
MRFRELGRTGLEVSEIGLGCGFLAWDESFYFPRLFARALELGITTYDTADFYCDYQSEVWLGHAFVAERSRVVLITKFGSMPAADGELHKDWSVDHMRRSLAESLRRLRTDYIDVYLLHSPGLDALDNVDLLHALRELKQAGKIRAFGLSLYGVELCREAMSRWQPDVVQLHYNVFAQGPAELLPEAQAAGVGVIARRPLDAGMLGGNLSERAPSKRGDPRPRWGAELTAHRQRAFEELRSATQGSGLSPAQVALRFVLSQPAISTVIPSTTSLTHLEENVAAAGGTLSPAELARIEHLRQTLYDSATFGY